MKTLLSAIGGVLVAFLLIWAKYRQMKSYTKDLGDGGIQKIFDNDSR
jgi:hypothetical protein